jgi:hypothetical protein
LDGPNFVGGGLVAGGTAVSADWQISAVKDFNGDGKSDILWRNSSGVMAEWNMNGTTLASGGLVNGGAVVPHDWIVA